MKILFAASVLALLASALPASAQSVTIGAPVIACDTPNGVGCNGRNVLRPGKYRVDHVVPYTGICHVTGSKWRWLYSLQRICDEATRELVR